MKSNLHLLPPSHHIRPSLPCQWFLALAWLVISLSSAQAATYSLGKTSLLEGPTAGIDGVILVVTPESAPWTASANASWLHLTPQNQSGSGSANIIFTYDANP